MSGVDDRIVGMKFDNAAFEQKMAETIRSLDKLSATIDMASAKQGLDNLAKASNNFNMGNMGSTIEGVSAKFLAMSTVGITALATLTSHAISSATRIASSFTINPVGEGFSDYNEKLTSVQTIMNATGASIDTVNGYFTELDTYADKTIYNLRDMTGAFAKFTNAGLEMDVSVPAIKGIANMVALAGQGADAASIAMYNLSQSIAGGFLTTTDYKSLNLANVATKEWKEQMIAGAEAAGTLKKNVDGTYQVLGDDKAFKGAYTDAALFTEALSEGWATAGVLTTVLGNYGDATTDIGKKALAAAQDVKSFPMMIETLKASVGTGWTSTFEILLGNVEESKALFTELTGSVQGFLDKFSNARNNLLQGWKDLGGRDLAIQALRDAFAALAGILGPIRDGFREIFPPMTAERLVEITRSILDFIQALRPGPETMEKIANISTAFFGTLKTGWTIIKEVASLFGDFLGSLRGVGGGAFDLADKFAGLVIQFNYMLVEGGGIHNFFLKLRDAIKEPIEFIGNLTEAIVGFFGSGEVKDTVSGSVERVGSRFEHLTEVWQRFTDRLEGVFGVLSTVWEYVSTWFSELGSKIAEAFQPGDFDAAVDVVNVGLLGGIALMLKKFLDGGFKDFGTGIIDKIKGALDGVTGTLQAMQTNLKADALLKIAAALGILTASIVVLSLIDSAALTKALVAITVGFTQLIGAMTLMDQLVGSAGAAAKLGILGIVLIELSVAIGILSLAITNISQLSLDELAKGLGGVAVGLLLLAGATQLIASDTAGLISAGIAMSAIAVAMFLLSKAVASFAEMSWAEMAKGLVGIAVGLALVVTAMNAMPPGGVLAGLGFIEIAVGLRILAESVEAFSRLGWAEMAKGMVGIAAGLTIIAAAMNLMPLSLPITAAGVLILSGALLVMAKAVKMMGAADLGTLAKGVGAFAAMLLILALGVNAMNGAVTGAAALLVVAGALTVLARVLKEIGNLSWQELLTGLGGLAAVFLLLGGAALILQPLVPALLGLGVAVGVIGGAFALFGVGAMLVAKAIEILATSGVKGMEAFVEGIKLFLTVVPEVASAVAIGIIKMAEDLLNAAPLLIRLITAVLEQLLETVIKLSPKLGEAFVTFVLVALKAIRETFPDFVKTGYELLLEFLRGIRDNIRELITVTTEIIIELARGLVENMPTLVAAAVQIITAFFYELANHAQELVSAGLTVLSQFLQGIADNIYLVIDAVGNIVVNMVTALSGQADKFVTAGADALISFVSGIGENIQKVIDAGTNVIIEFVESLANNSLKVINAAADILVDFLHGLAEAIRTHSEELRDAGWDLAKAIMDGVSFGMFSLIGDVFSGAGLGGTGWADELKAEAKKQLESKSPSKKFIEVGEAITQGVGVGMYDTSPIASSTNHLKDTIITRLQDVFKKIPDAVDVMDEFNPVITPVLDLTRVQSDAGKIDGFMKASAITPEVSLEGARIISATATLTKDDISTPTQTVPTEVTFEQNIYAPTALSTNDIYRNTKSQIVLAKEELGIS